MANIVKSHHTVDFFRGELDRLTQRYAILVIHRHPVDVMLSWWRFMYHFPKGDYGPLLPDPVTFALAPPAGLMLRYQTHHISSNLERWAGHIDDWLTAAGKYSNIGIVRYADLHDHYEKTMLDLPPLLGRPPLALTRPSREVNVIRRGPDDPLNTGIPPDLEALRCLCREKVGDTVARLGY